MPRELHLAVDIGGSGHRPAASLTAPYWTALTQLAEQGAFDFLTLGDPFAPAPEDGAGRLDPVAVLARVAPLTRRIGLVPAVTTTHTEPFHTSTALATLDFVSEGRAGWLVEVSGTAAEARAVGRRRSAPAAELWAEAADAAEVAARLWDSWEDDAEIRDAATGRFIDRERLHYVDFEGPHFSVRGPSIVPRPPQGRPPVVVALGAHDPDTRGELAAHHADVVLLDAADPASARAAREALLDRAGERQPRVLLKVTLDLRDGFELPPTPGLRFTGAATALAAQLAEWHTATGVDGFHLVPTTIEAELPLLVHGLVPRLREAGLFRAAYQGRTLRDHLGLPRPASRYAHRVEALR